jgi:hypothetical protein
MASLTIPSFDVPIAECTHCNQKMKCDQIWYKKFAEWIKKTNQDNISGKLTVAATSDTNLRFSYVGSDGVTRTADLTLS